MQAETPKDAVTSKGVLFPGRVGDAVTIVRYEPAPELSHLVRHYWIPRWRLPDGEVFRQEVLQYPTTNLVVGSDFAGVFGVTPGRSERELRGEGWSFGVMFHPAAGRAILGDGFDALSSGMAAVDPTLTSAVRATSGDDREMIVAFEAWFAQLAPEPTADALLATEIVRAVEHDRDLVRVEQLAARFSLSERSLQRLCARYIGVSPKWIVQRFRLQEAAFELVAEPSLAIAELAARLGFADQAHFTRDFTTVVGMPPHAYRMQNS